MIVEGSSSYARTIREVVGALPAWYVRAARVSRIEVSSAPEVRDQVAMYEHGSRRVRVAPGIGKDFLTRALAHELGHGCDDYSDHPHFFSSADAWQRIHAMQMSFDHPKYGVEALEYFADIFSKIILRGTTRLAVTNPYEVKFFSEWVIPTLQKEFG